MFGSPYRLGLVLGMEASLADDRKAQLDYFRKNIKKAYKQIPPTIVDDGPVCENIVRGDDIDVEAFPVPVHHELDGGRYIGTACGVVTRDPDTGRINVGTYRVMVKGARTLASYISNGKQAASTATSISKRASRVRSRSSSASIRSRISRPRTRWPTRCPSTIGAAA